MPDVARLYAWNPAAYGEIVTADCYRVRGLRHPPTVVLDIGANRGVFTGYAKHLWPESRVLALEPFPVNMELLRENVADLSGVTVLHGLLGTKPPAYCYVGDGCGGVGVVTETPWYPAEWLAAQRQAGDCHALDLPVYRLPQLLDLAAVSPEDRVLVKIDTEGAEGSLLASPAAAAAVAARVAYLRVELHWYVSETRFYDDYRAKMLAWLGSFWQTHRLELEAQETCGYAWLDRYKEWRG